MTTSTETNKKVKAKGPIRTEAVVPVAIIILLTILYARFFFDSHLRKTIEWTATFVHGAEVNVEAVHSSFFNGSFEMRGLQVTDKTMPARNLIEIGQIRFKFLWDALLRAKFVVDDSGIEGIQVYSPRKKPGYVKPPEPPSNEPSAMAKLQNTVLDQTKDEFSGNAVGDLAALLDGQDEKDLLKNIQGELKAEQTIKALQADLKEKEKLWKERIDKLPNKEEFEALSKRAKALKFDTSNPKQFAADLKEASKIAKEADDKIDFVKESSSTLKSDIDKFNGEFKSIDDLIKKDIEDIEARLKIPKLDMQDLSKNIFGKMFADKIVSVKKYMEVGRKYMPPAKDPNAKKEEELIPPPRGAGKNYHFPITTGYPVFWLKKATISSEPTSEGFAGRVSGSLTNVTTSPKVVGKPAILDVKGDFPKAQVMNAALLLTVDHINEPKESLALSVGSFPLAQVELVKSDKIGLGIKKAEGSSQLSAILERDRLDIQLRNQFGEVDYDLIAKSKVVNEAVTTVLAGIPTITLNAGAQGTWSKIDFSLNSNLGKELSEGFSRYVKAKIDEKKKQIREFIDSRIGGEKEKLESEYKKLKGQVDEKLNSKKAEVDKAKNDVKNQTSTSGKSKKDALKEQGKKLLKGFKFK